MSANLKFITNTKGKNVIAGLVDIKSASTKTQVEYCPGANIYIQEGKVFIVLAIPGFYKKDISVSVENNMIAVSANKKKGAISVHWLRREFDYDNFFRKFAFPEHSKLDQLQIAYSAGQLILSFPTFSVPSKIKGQMGSLSSD